jgi:hypothetical protein
MVDTELVGTDGRVRRVILRQGRGGGEVVIPESSGARHPFGQGFEEMALAKELVALAYQGQGY